MYGLTPVAVAREAGTSKQGVYQAIRRGVLRRGPDGLIDPGSSRTSPGSNHCPSVGPAGLIGRGTPLNVANVSRLPRFGTSNSRRWLPRAWSAGARMRTSAVKCTRSLYISDNPRFPYVECRENSSFYGAGKWTALGVYTAQPACSKSGSFPGFRVLRGAARAADRARGWDFKAGCVPSDPARRAAARPSYEPRPAHLIARAGPYRSVQILRGPAFARAMSGLTPVAVAREAGTSKQGVYQAIRRGVLRRGPDGLIDPGSSRTSPGSNHCPSVGPAGLIGRGTPLNVANASRLPRFGTSNSRRWLPRAWSAGARMRTSAVKCTRSLYISDNPRFPYVECRENSSFYGAGKWTALGVYTAQPACSKSGSFPGFRVYYAARREPRIGPFSGRGSRSVAF